MVLTRDTAGRWCLLDDDGVHTLDRPVALPPGQRAPAVVYLLRLAVSLALRGHP